MNISETKLLTAMFRHTTHVCMFRCRHRVRSYRDIYPGHTSPAPLVVQLLQLGSHAANMREDRLRGKVGKTVLYVQRTYFANCSTKLAIKTVSMSVTVHWRTCVMTMFHQNVRTFACFVFLLDTVVIFAVCAFCPVVDIFAGYAVAWTRCKRQSQRHLD